MAALLRVLPSSLPERCASPGPHQLPALPARTMLRVGIASWAPRPVPAPAMTAHPDPARVQHAARRHRLLGASRLCREARRR